MRLPTLDMRFTQCLCGRARVRRNGVFPYSALYVTLPRKRLVEIQYLHTTITEEQRQEFGHLVEATIRRIEACEFLPHSGIRFPQNPCTSCPYIGLCLGKQQLIETTLVRRPGEDLGWLDELNC